MTGAERSWRTTLHAAILDQSRARILLCQGQGGMSLPGTVADERVWSAHAAVLVQVGLRTDLGLEAVVLHMPSTETDEARCRTEILVVVEMLDPAWVPPAGASWIDRDTLATQSLAAPGLRPTLDLVLREAEGITGPPERPPWTRPGWYASALPWLIRQAEARGYAPRGEVVQVKTWPLSVVLRVATTRGDVYMKQAARLPLFADEPLLVNALAHRYPEVITAPLAVELERDWMLLPDVGQELRGEIDLELLEATVRTWGAIQRDAAGDPHRLLREGCLDRRLPVLQTQIGPLLEAADAFVGLEAHEIAEIRALAPRLSTLCDRLAAFGIPPSLVHGDLHWGNIARRDGRIAIFDWTDGCLAHPFFDLATLLDLPDEFPDRPTAVERLRTAYLAAFADLAPGARLREATAIAEVLGALHQVISYHTIVAGIEEVWRPSLAEGITFFWREVLRTVRLLPR